MNKITLKNILNGAPGLLGAIGLSMLLACTQAPYEMKEVREQISKRRQKKIKEQKQEELQNSSPSSARQFVYKPVQWEDSSRTLFKQGLLAELNQYELKLEKHKKKTKYGRIMKPPAIVSPLAKIIYKGDFVLNQKNMQELTPDQLATLVMKADILIRSETKVERAWIDSILFSKDLPQEYQNLPPIRKARKTSEGNYRYSRKLKALLDIIVLEISYKKVLVRFESLSKDNVNRMFLKKLRVEAVKILRNKKHLNHLRKTERGEYSAYDFNTPDEKIYNALQRVVEANERYGVYKKFADDLNINHQDTKSDFGLRKRIINDLNLHYQDKQQIRVQKDSLSKLGYTDVRLSKLVNLGISDVTLQNRIDSTVDLRNFQEWKSRDSVIFKHKLEVLQHLNKKTEKEQKESSEEQLEYHLRKVWEKKERKIYIPKKIKKK